MFGSVEEGLDKDGVHTMRVGSFCCFSEASSEAMLV
jgi:hypothetical protein